MHPILFKIPILGGITIYSYGVMVALAFIVAILWATHESKRQGQDPTRMMDLIFYVIIAGIAGSRILHVLVSERGRFAQNPLMIFKIWEGGLVFYGGLIASLVVGIWYVRRRRMPMLLTYDICAPAIALGHCVGRIGCLLAGCCYGRAVGYNAWYAIAFPQSPRTFAPVEVALYPTQLMESVGEFLIFITLIVVRRFKRFDGQLMATYLILYAILRYFNEFFRGDALRGFLIDPWLSTSQLISAIMCLVGVMMYIGFWRRRKKVAI